MDGSKFFAVMGRANAAVSGFGASVASSISGRLAAAFSVGAIGMMAKRTVDFADSLDKMSIRLGVGTDKLQEWTFAAKLAGADATNLTTFIERLSLAASDLKNAPVFAKMGINPEGMTPEQLFSGVSSWARGQQSTDVMATLSQIIDKRALGPMIGLLKADLDEAGESARRLGAVIDRETITGLVNFKDQMEIVGSILISNFAPALVWAGKTIVESIGNVKAAAAWWGARTANITAADVARALAPGSGAKDLGKKFAQGKQMGMGDIADEEAAKILNQFEEILQRLTAYKPAAPPTIGPPDMDAATKSRTAGGQVSSDSLVSVGNFLGASMRNRLVTLTEQQLQVSRETLRAIQMMADSLKTKQGATGTGFPT